MTPSLLASLLDSDSISDLSAAQVIGNTGRIQSKKRTYCERMLPSRCCHRNGLRRGIQGHAFNLPACTSVAKALVFYIHLQIPHAPESQVIASANYTLFSTLTRWVGAQTI